jgi:hypothetical protein
VYDEHHSCSSPYVVREYDVVERPRHYNQGDIECIDAIQSMLTPTEWQGYLRGQVAKYLWRLGSKDALEQDARKLKWYATWLTGVDPRK